MADLEFLQRAKRKSGYFRIIKSSSQDRQIKISSAKQSSSPLGELLRMYFKGGKKQILEGRSEMKEGWAKNLVNMSVYPNTYITSIVLEEI